MEVVDGCMGARGSHLSDSLTSQTRSNAKNLTSKLLALPLPNSVERHVATVLMNLFPNRTEYLNYKV